MQKIIWLQGVTCNGNSHSFLNYEYLDSFLDDFSFLYHPLLPTKYSLGELIYLDFDVLILEGGIKKGWKKYNFDLEELFLILSNRAKKVISVGSCASYGGIFKEYDKTISGALFNKDKISKYYDKLKDKTINIPGCPAHPEWIIYGIKSDVKNLDKLNRPKEIFACTVHSGCSRNEYFEWKVDAKNFGTKEGCLFYEQGCQAPYTHGSCNKILWNGINSKTRNGSPCFGCTEPSFPKDNLFSTKTYMGIPAEYPLGVSKRAYLTLTGVAKSFKIDRLQKDIFDED